MSTRACEKRESEKQPLVNRGWHISAAKSNLALKESFVLNQERNFAFFV